MYSGLHGPGFTWVYQGGYLDLWCSLNEGVELVIAALGKPDFPHHAANGTTLISIVDIIIVVSITGIIVATTTTHARESS